MTTDFFFLNLRPDLPKILALCFNLGPLKQTCAMNFVDSQVLTLCTSFRKGTRFELDCPIFKLPRQPEGLALLCSSIEKAILSYALVRLLASPPSHKVALETS